MFGDYSYTEYSAPIDHWIKLWKVEYFFQINLYWLILCQMINKLYKDFAILLWISFDLIMVQYAIADSAHSTYMSNHPGRQVGRLCSAMF